MTFAQFLRKPFLTEHLRWLLLYMIILVTLLLILKICLSVEINFWKTPLKITVKNLRSFQGTYLWRSSILVKALSLWLTVNFLMILKLMVLRNFIINISLNWKPFFFLVAMFLLTFHSICCTGLWLFYYFITLFYYWIYSITSSQFTKEISKHLLLRCIKH